MPRRFPLHRILAAAVVLASASCSGSPPPIPVVGSPAAVTALVGEWSGEYSSAMTERRGDISFSLVAQADTAYGDVLMQPHHTAHAGPSGESGAQPSPGTPEGLAAQSLRVSFVSASTDSVYGRLDPYLDPDCACRLETHFFGRLRGDTIEGRYVSRRESTGELVEGTWRLERKR